MLHGNSLIPIILYGSFSFIGSSFTGNTISSKTFYSNETDVILNNEGIYIIKVSNEQGTSFQKILIE